MTNDITNDSLTEDKLYIFKVQLEWAKAMNVQLEDITTTVDIHPSLRGLNPNDYENVREVLIDSGIITVAECEYKHNYAVALVK